MICCCLPAAQNYHYVGGLGASSPLATNYQYAGSWSTKAALPNNLFKSHGATPSTTGPAWLYGGNNGTGPGQYLTTSQNYVPDTWASDTALPSPGRNWHTGPSISALAYAWGGETAAGFPATLTAQNDQMTPGSPSTWATKTAVTTALEVASSTYIGAKGYNFCGAKSGSVSVATNYEYDPSGDSWATKTAYPASARQGMAAWTISGTAYCVDGGPNLVPLLESYVVDTWTSKATPPTGQPTDAAEYHAGASLDAAGVGYVTGGAIPVSGNPSQIHVSYTPNSWSTLSNVTTASQHAVGVFA